MIRAEPITAAEAKQKRGIMDLAPRQGNLYAFDPRLLRIEVGFNARLVDFDPADDEDLALARSIAEVGVKQPLTVYMKDGEPTVTDGHRRLGATLYAMDALGADIKSVPVQTETKHASATDRAYSPLLRNSNKPLSPIERANQYAKLIGLGHSEGDIAVRIGKSRQHVTDMLALRAAPQAVVDLVQAGEVSATLASQTIKAAKGDSTVATEKLVSAVTAAKAAGKTRATAKHVERKAPDLSKHPAYAAGLKRAVEIVRDGGWAEAAEAVEAVMVGE